MKLNKQKLIKVNAPFIDEMSGLAIVKILDGDTHSTLVLKLKFIWKKTLDKINKGTHTVIFKPEEMIGIIIGILYVITKPNREYCSKT